jgi:hypothetical protein
MIQPNTIPEATAPPEYQADFLELWTLRSEKRGMSAQEFVRDLRIGNATESIADADDLTADDDDEETEDLAQQAFDEIDERQRCFGPHASCYPFTVATNSVTLRPGGDESLYTFLALLSWFGKDAGPKGTDGEKIFEDVCARAAAAYLGGAAGRATSVIFGFPRRTLPSGFAAALNSVCQTMGEGVGHRAGRDKLPDQKDAKLDIITWVEFHDRRQGKLINFGQCATGRNWNEKVSELPDPGVWCGLWMQDNPAVSPMRSFFVPHRVERRQWYLQSRLAGLLFDRCRIASLACDAEDPIRKQWIDWSAHVLQGIRGSAP